MQPPFGMITKAGKLAFNVLSIVLKNRVKHTPDIFKHDRLWPYFISKPDSFRKKVSFVVTAELLSRFGKGRARYATGQQVNTLVFFTGKISYISTGNIPGWPIQQKGITGGTLYFNECDMVKPGKFKAESLTAGTGAYFNGTWHCLPPFILFVFVQYNMNYDR
jgi:hypothetical protein